MINKRGFLLAEETIKIIIALICIVFLVYFLLSLYFSKVQNENIKYAKATLIDSDDSIKAVIDRVKSGISEGGSEIKLVHNPKGWYLFSFTGNKIKPNSCAGENCVCICDNVYSVSLVFWKSEEERQAGKCSDKGVCLIEEDLREFGEIEITEATELTIKNERGLIIEGR